MSKTPYEIIHEDADLLIVSKPAGLLTIPDRFRTDIPNLQNMLRRQYGEIFVVHRLDKDTSGVICFARNAEAHRHLSLQFQEHTPKKIYWMLVEGCMEEGAQGLIDAPLIADEQRAGSMRVQAKGKPAQTEYKAIEYFRHFTTVEFVPRTGRTHQIRVHAAHIGFPPAVDPLYGSRDGLQLSEIKQRRFNLKKWENEQPLLSRVPLHALSLTVVHPTTNETTTFSAPLPKDLRAVVQQLAKWDSTQQRIVPT